MLVLDCLRYKSFAGGNVTVYGGIFKSNYTVKIGNSEFSPIDVGESFFVFSAPKDVGEYSFNIMDGNAVIASGTLFVTAMADAPTYRLPERTQENYTEMMVGMMPRGSIFNIIRGTNFYKLFSGIAAGFKCVCDMFKQMIFESSPLTTDCVDDFENEYGLPRSGLILDDENGRKKEIYRISRQQGGCTVPHYAQLMDVYGKDYKIYEFWKNPEKFPDWVSEYYGSQAVFCVLIKVYQEQFGRSFKCNSKCNAALGNERDLFLEKLLNYDKPAHVKFIFEYAIRVLTNESGAPLTTDDGKLLIV